MITTLTPHPPCEIRAANRHARNETIWGSPEWKAASKTYLAHHPICEYCGAPSEIAHHDEDWMYFQRDVYLDLERWATPACRSCHTMLRRGYMRCPECGGWMWPGRQRCSRCESDETRTARKIRKLRLNRARSKVENRKRRKWKKKEVVGK